jgi:valyl-tRNA synthetase
VLTASARTDVEAGILARVLALARVDLAENLAREVVATVAVPGGALVIAACDGVRAEDVAELDRRQREHLIREIGRAASRLDNPRFVSNATPSVVDAERVKLARLATELAAIGGEG